MAALFFWHTQQRSDMGFITVIWGVRVRHNEQKVVYAAVLSPVSSQAVLYRIQTFWKVMDKRSIVRKGEGSEWEGVW